MNEPHRLDADELRRALHDRVVGRFEITAEDRVDAYARRGACVALLIAAITVVPAIATYS
jgi:hypothetical protein